MPLTPFIRLLPLNVACNLLPLTHNEENTFLLLEMVRGVCICVYVFLHLISPASTSQAWWWRVFVASLQHRFGSDLSMHTCCCLHRQKSQLSHGCCTAAALFLDPQEEVIVRSCSTGTGEKPGGSGSLSRPECRPSVDRLVGVLPSRESHSHC